MAIPVRLRGLCPLWLALAVSLLLFVRLSPDQTARALPANDIADVVFGQNGNFTTNTCLPVSATSLCNTVNGSGIAVDAAGNVYIADRQNNRVLEFDTPLTTDTVADRVFGQNGDFSTNTCLPLGADSLCRPADIALDSAGRLWVMDTSNNRVLVYNSPLTTDTVADAVLGQAGSFTTAGGCESVTASSICFTTGRGGIAVDGDGNVFVAERNRVIEFTSPLTTDEVADRVFGQAGSFTTNTCGQGIGITANTLCAPSAVAVDPAGNVYIVDAQNHRVLEYDTPSTLDTTADRVLGQGNFVNGTCNGGGLPNLASLCTTFAGTPNGGITLDAAGNVYVSDLGNARVLEFDAPLTTDALADRVFGQEGNAAATDCGTGAGHLCAPVGVATDSAGTLFVVDAGNNRAVAYLEALKPSVAADAVFGQLGSFRTSLCGLTADSVCNSGGVAVDTAGNVYIADRLRHRVLGYYTPLTTDTTADRVFGQGGSFTSGTCNLGGRSADSLCNPIGLAVDGAGNLYIADVGGNRVLQYDTPLTTDTTADRVFGQSGDFTTAGCNVGGTSATTLCFVNNWGDVTVDDLGNVYIADSPNNRVLEYDTPLTTDTVADRVFGQLNFFDASSCNLSGLSATSLCMPTGVTVDSAGNLYVVDGNNNRVLGYDTPLTGDTVADHVFGQGESFTAGSCNNGGLGPGSLCLSQFGSSRGSIDVDGAGNVFVADSVNQRVLEYDTPLATDVTADRVYGHLAQDYGTARCNNGGVSRGGLCRPEGIEVDGAGSLYVADSMNNRVLVFVAGADVDGDGCSDVEEFGTNQARGGKRDPDSRWDFFDVPAPTGPDVGADGKPIFTPASVRNKSVTLQDVGVVLAYVGRASTNAAYKADNNADGKMDGQQLDRTPSVTLTEPWQSGPPNNAINLQDVGIALAQVGQTCLPAP